jgi:hypothetical protein
LGGKYGCPRPVHKNADGTFTSDVPVAEQTVENGNPLWFAGGVDRTEVYQCPFTGNLYLTGTTVSGPYTPKNISKFKKSILLYSKDSGKNWGLVKDDFNPGGPLVMTSSPNGRLFLSRNINGQPTIYFSKNAMAPGVKPDMSEGFPVFYKENGSDIHLEVDPDTDLTNQIRATPSLSRISTDNSSSKVRLAYPSLNQNKRQEVRIVRIGVNNPNDPPAVKPVKTIQSKDPVNYSIVNSSFIEPDYIDEPPGIPTHNASVLYWIEAPQKDVSNKQFAARYALFTGGASVTEPEYLSVQNGVARTTWNSYSWPGHYMKGGFFYRGNTLNYLAQWREPTGIRANIVTVGGLLHGPNLPP